MDETVSDKSSRNFPLSLISKVSRCLKTNKLLFVFLLLLTIPAWVPLYVILFPPLVDMPEHILISKLFLEKLIGTSNLDLDISWFLGYRLFPIVVVFLIGASKLFAIPLLYLPKIIVFLLIAFHAVVVGTVHYYANTESTWRSRVLTLCFSLPAVVAMYSACWYIGFVNYTLAVTLLIPTIVFTERFLHKGKLLDASLLFLSLFLVYTAHPFAIVFWLIWCLGRLIASCILGTVGAEWKRTLLLGLPFLPHVIYHLAATSGSGLAFTTTSFFSQSPFVSPDHWLKTRVLDLVNGEYLKAESLSDPFLFAVAAIGLIVASAIVSFHFKQSEIVKKLALSNILFIFIASWLNEKFFPVPGGFWLAYDYRFSTTIYIVGLSVAGFILIRSIPASTENTQRKVVLYVLAFISVTASFAHLVGVQRAYARYDVQARKYMEKVFNYETPIGIALPHSRWHPDGTLIKHYICLVEPDCNPENTFFTVFGGDLYPVVLRSRKTKSDKPTANSIQADAARNEKTLSKPRGIAPDGSGNYYVADTGNSRIKKFDAVGNLLSVFGKTGTGEGELREPNGIAVDRDRNIYLTDAANGTLVKFSPDGRLIKEWKGPPPGLYGPRDIEFGPNGKLYIIDQGNGRIVRFDPKTEEFDSWGTLGNAEGQFHESTGITVGDGLVFVMDNGNNRIQVFDLEGKFVRQWDVTAWNRFVWHYPDAIYDKQNKRLYVTSGITNEVLAFDTQGNPIETGLKPEDARGIKNPGGIVDSETGTKRMLFMLDTEGSSVSSIDLNANRSR